MSVCERERERERERESFWLANLEIELAAEGTDAYFRILPMLMAVTKFSAQDPKPIFVQTGAQSNQTWKS
jgi:hypothetical protein